MGWHLEPIEKGTSANLVVLDKNRKWKFEKEHIYSRSTNSPFIGMNFTGKIEAVILGKKLLIID